MKTLFVFVSVIVMAATGLHAEPSDSVEEWMTDYDQARKVAAEKSQPILINFTGSDWCGWCIRLDREVFSKSPFKNYAKQNLVLLKIDFPNKIQLPESQVKQNQALAEKFEVSGFPTILLIGADGKEIARTGYQSGGAAAYVKHIKGLLD